MQFSELSGDQLRRGCDESLFSDVRTAETDGFNEIIGQQRAVEAIEFGMDIDRDGFNIFALGPSGSGRASIISRYVQHKSSEKPVPDDWRYVNNFQDQRKPIAAMMSRRQSRVLERYQVNLIVDNAQTEGAPVILAGGT